MKVKIEITGKMMFCEYASKEVLMAEAKDEILRLSNSLNDEHIIGISDSMTAQEKIEVIRMIIKQVVVTRLGKYILEMMIENKVTGEKRTLIINTKKM